MTRDMIGVRMRLQHADEPDAPACALIQIAFDRVGRIDDDSHTGVLVTDDVRPAAEVVVDELREEHRTKLATAAAIYSEVRITRTALVALVAALLAPAAAWAHASLVRTAPANGAVLAHSPAVVRVTFDDTVRPGPGIAAIRNGGASVLAGHARVTGGKTLVVPLRRGLADGDYSVRWSIVSDDGHLESGVIAFARRSRPRAPGRRSRGRGDGPDGRERRNALALPRRRARRRRHCALHVRRPAARAGAHSAHRVDGGRARGARRGPGDPSREPLHARRQGPRRGLRRRARRRDARRRCFPRPSHAQAGADRRVSACGDPVASPAMRSTRGSRASTSSWMCCMSSRRPGGSGCWSACS